MTLLSILTLPARTAGAVAVAGLRTTARVAGWALEQAGGTSTPVGRSQWSSHPAPVSVPDVPGVARIDPMAATRTAPRKAPARKAPATKVPASQVPLKSAPTPSLPAATRAATAAPATNAPVKKAATKKAPTKKASTKKASAKKAPSKQAAVLAPALGLSESEVAEVLEKDVDKS